MMESEYFQSKDYFSIENRSKAMLSFFLAKNMGEKTKAKKQTWAKRFIFPKPLKCVSHITDLEF